MKTFEFSRPADPAAAIAAAARAKTAQQGADVRFLAGGTTLIDLMKLNVETPALVVDINRLPLNMIEATPEGGLKIGATVRNSELAYHPTVQRDYAVLSQALLSRRLGPEFETWRQRLVTSCNERGVCISATRRCPATSANPAPAVRPSPAATAHWPSWAQANTASRPTRRTCA